MLRWKGKRARRIRPEKSDLGIREKGGGKTVPLCGHPLSFRVQGQPQCKGALSWRTKRWVFYNPGKLKQPGLSGSVVKCVSYTHITNNKAVELLLGAAIIITK